MVRVCIVCLGNICRSPTAEGILKRLVSDAGLDAHVHVESAGTGSWHVGQEADPRTRKEALRRGVELNGRARHFTESDFDRFDYVISVDAANLNTLRNLTGGGPGFQKLSLLRDYDPESPDRSDVPDPYYGGKEGFSHVFDVCEAACVGLLASLRRRHEF